MSTMIVSPIRRADGCHEQALAFGIPPKTRKSNRCRFENTVYVKEIPNIGTYTAFEKQMCWYSKDDYRSFRVSMILERATVDFRDQQKTIPSKNKNNSVDQCPILPNRSHSPEPDQERDQTQRSLPMNFPLHFDDDSDDESDDEPISDVEDDLEEQLLKAKAEKFRRLREQSKTQAQPECHPMIHHNSHHERQKTTWLERTQYRFPPHHPLQNLHREMENQNNVVLTSPMLSMKQLEHLHFQSSLYYPGSPVMGSVGSTNGGECRTAEILDSALSVVEESRNEGVAIHKIIQ